MDYLDDAISKLELSEGDITERYQAILLRQVELRLKASMAQSLAKIAAELKRMNDND